MSQVAVRALPPTPIDGRVARRRTLGALGLTLLFVMIMGHGVASAATSVSKLRAGGATAAEDYLYTSGSVVYAQAAADPGSYYRFVVSDPAGVTDATVAPRLTSACNKAPAKGAIGATYTIGANDPASNGTAWRFRLQQFTAAGCSGTPAKTAQLYFDVVKASAYSDQGLLAVRSAFTAGSSAYVKLAGLGSVKASAANATVNDWSATWVLPSGATACANTANGDRIGSTASGSMQSSVAALGAPGFLQYRPNSSATGDTWNQESLYETRPCPAFADANQGAWRLRVLRDNQHFVTLPVFTVDTTAPQTSIAGGPTNVTSASTAAFNLTAGEPGATFECRLDGGSWTTCGATVSYPGLASGPHTFTARATDGAGNTDATPASQSWTVDTSVPAVTLSSPGAGSWVTTTTPTFAGAAGTDAGDVASVTVRVYSGSTAAGTPVRTLSASTSGASWSVAASPALTEGTYTVQAEQRDTATPANTGFTDARTFTIDSIAPHVSLALPVKGSSTSDATPLFSGGAGTAADDSAVVSVDLFDGATATGSPLQSLTTTATNGSWSVPATGALPEGTYTVRAAQSDAAGNVATTSPHTFTVDQTAPQTDLLSGPAGATSSTFASFRFTSSEPGSTFECQLDGASWSACTSPRSLSGLAPGAHTFVVRAVDAARNADPSPPTQTWTVDTSLPAIELTAPADGSFTNSTTPALTGTADTGPGDASTVTVKLAGVTPGGPAPQTLTAVRSSSDGSWSVHPSALVDGMYVFHAEQVGTAGTGYSASRTFTVDSSAPQTSITLGPAGATAATTASFRFSSSQAGSSFECRLDGGSWATCSSPKSYTGLGQGAHTFMVRAIDPAGNVDSDPALQTWTIDSALAAVSLTAPDDGATTSDPSPALSGSAGTAPGDAATVTVKLYAGTTTSGTPLQTLTTTRASSGGAWTVHPAALAEGEYVFHAEQEGTAGTSYSASRAFTVDTTPPSTTLTFATEGPTAATDARFAFRSSETGSTFECRLDGVAWQACSSPRAYSGLSVDQHTFEVRAVDAAGTPDPTPATQTWLIDSSAPLVTLAAPADGSVTNDTTPVFSGAAGTAAGDGPGVTVEVFSVDDSSTPVQTLTASIVAGSWAVTPAQAFGDGTYVAYAEQQDATGNTAYSAGGTFTIDTTPPAVTLTAPAGGTLTNDVRPALRGTAGTDAGDDANATVKLYAGTTIGGTPVQTLSAVVATDGTWSVTPTADLADGSYTARAEQSDSAGNTDHSARRTFTIDATAPDTSLTSGPSTTTTSTGAAFQFASSEPASTFECRLDGAAWTSCTSPATRSNLAVGAHTFDVRASDAAGNRDPTPASATWTIQAPPPPPTGSGDTSTGTGDTSTGTGGTSTGTGGTSTGTGDTSTGSGDTSTTTGNTTQTTTPGTTVDVTGDSAAAPVLKLTLKKGKTTRALLRRGSASILARCSAACRITTSSKVVLTNRTALKGARARKAAAVRGGTLSFKAVSRRLAGAVTAKVTIKLSPKTRARVRRLLTRNRIATVTVVATAKAADGRQTRVRLTFKVTR